MKILKYKLQSADLQNDGFISGESLNKVLLSIKATSILPSEIERFVRQLNKDKFNRINY